MKRIAHAQDGDAVSLWGHQEKMAPGQVCEFASLQIRVPWACVCYFLSVKDTFGVVNCNAFLW